MLNKIKNLNLHRNIRCFSNLKKPSYDLILTQDNYVILNV